MINDAYDYLIGKTNSIVTSYSESFAPDAPTLACVYRLTGGFTSKSLSKSRQYTQHAFNVLIRGNQDSEEIAAICDSVVNALDMDSVGVVICVVTSEPQYAYTDDNGNLNYTFNVEVVI